MAKHLKVSSDKKSIIKEEVRERQIFRADLERQKESLEKALVEVNELLVDYDELESKLE